MDDRADKRAEQQIKNKRQRETRKDKTKIKKEKYLCTKHSVNLLSLVA